jgi:nitrate reductase NapAB chaperone NapD
MPISGLVITFSPDQMARRFALEALRSHPSIEVGGDRRDARVPVVVETSTSDEDRAVWLWLHELPGVQFVEVVYVHFDHEEDLQEVDHNP